MKKFVVMMFLIALISLSAALPENTPGSQVGFNFGDVKINQIADPSGADTTVNIKSYSFQPATLRVPAGTTVTWSNLDNVQHTVTSDVQGLFNSGVIMPGKQFVYTFVVPGTYSYHCSIHPGMKGTITVTAAQATEPTVTRTRLSPSAIQETASVSTQIGTGNDGSASWSQKPISGLTTTSGSGNAITQTALQSKNIQLNLNTPVSQSQSQESGQIALQQFSQYYRSSSGAPKNQLTAPTKIDLKGAEPETLYFGSTQKAVPYSQYQTYALTTGANSLWIQGASSWTQYAVVPLGSTLTMITMSPAGGNGYIYEIYPDGSLDKSGYYFYPYNQVGFYADEVGEHQLFFNIDGQPSNVIVIDVAPYQMPAPPTYGYALVTVSSSWLRGYNVYVDGSYQATEGTTGESDGTVTISVQGNQYHNIAIDGNGFTFSDYKYFNAGYAYTLSV